MTSDSEWFRNVEGCGPPGMWRGVVHMAGVRKEFGDCNGSWPWLSQRLAEKERRLRGVISAPRACTEMRTMAHFKGKKAEAIERAGTKAQRRNHHGSRVPQASWI